MPKVPKVLVEPNSFEFQVNNFQCRLDLPNNWGLVDLVTQAADLYTAVLTPDAFRREYLENRNEKVKTMLDAIRDPGCQDQWRYLDFQVKMVHRALTDRWQYPALVTRHHDCLIWHTGGTRLLATGMVMPNPNLALRLLITDFDGDNTDAFENITVIQTDQDLSAVLATEYFEYRQYHPSSLGSPLQVYLEWQDTPGPCLHYINPRHQVLDWTNHVQLSHMPELMPMARHVLEQGKVRYWSADPAQLTDSTGSFELEWMGAADQFFSQSDLSSALYNHCKFGTDTGAVEWWIRPGITLDTCELWFWLDQQYTVYLDRDQDFAVMTEHGRYSKKIIAMSK